MIEPNSTLNKLKETGIIFLPEVVLHYQLESSKINVIVQNFPFKVIDIIYKEFVSIRISFFLKKSDKKMKNRLIILVKIA